MRLVNYVRATIVALVIAIFALGSINNFNVKAGNFQAGTSAADSPCGTAQSSASSAATSVATGAASAETPAATTESTTASTAEAAAPVKRARLGITASPVDDCGVKILTVLNGSPAWRASLEPGDIIIALNGISVADLVATPNYPTPIASYPSPVLQAFFGKIETFSAKDTITLTIIRRGTQSDVTVTFDALAIPQGTAAATTAAGS